MRQDTVQHFDKVKKIQRADEQETVQPRPWPVEGDRKEKYRK